MCQKHTTGSEASGQSPLSIAESVMFLSTLKNHPIQDGAYIVYATLEEGGF